jgi:hypothetical protein
LVGDNVYVNPTNGKQQCVTCRRAWQRETFNVKAPICRECGDPLPESYNRNVLYHAGCQAKRRARADAERYRRNKEVARAA